MARAKIILNSTRQQRGIGLIEVLIAMFVLAVGVLALGKLQGDFYGASAVSKARAEALAIAQGRLEEMRNYMHEAESLDDFNTLYTVGSKTAVIEGVNASFARKETIVADGQRRSVAVSVEWSDAAGETQAISLDTKLAFASPGGPGVLASVRNDFVVPSPAGRARLGEGNLPANAETSPNGDGTEMYIADGERKLVFGQKIVLTLEDACKTGTTDCTDFVQIKGRVFIDNATQESLAPGDIYVHASDAAFCTRYFYDSGGNVQTIDKAKSSDLLTESNKDYTYFHYTCYLGGGWHGNIGLLLAGGIKQTDKVCQGDPVSKNTWEAPVIAVRRAYRGMVYEKGVKEGGGVTRYKSHGIADGAILGDPGREDDPHDFVISSLSADSTEGSNCISQGVMVRADATSEAPGDEFAGNPDDFVCLNDGYLDLVTLGDKYGYDQNCPFDPTDPPVYRHEVKGSVLLSSIDTSVDFEAVRDAIQVNTSDGPGNCALDPFDTVDNSSASYTCDVYDWGPGWNGTIYTSAPGHELELACAPAPLELSIDGPSEGNDIECEVGNYAAISGRVTTANENKVLATVEILDGGTCQVGDAGLSYECRTDAFLSDSGWTGTLTFTLSDGVICSATADSDKISLSLDSGIATVSGITGYNDLHLDIKNSIDQCPAIAQVL